MDLDLPPEDPIRELRRQLERDYLDRLTISPAKVSRFLERHVAPFGTTSAASIPIETIDDFLAFEAVRVLLAGGLGSHGASRLSKTLEGRFVIEMSSEAVSNDWLECGGFLIRRLDDSVTLEARHAR
jgi:hypothetical protein